MPVQTERKLPSDAELLADPTISFWFKKALKDLVERDLLDALNDAELLVAVLKRRASGEPSVCTTTITELRTLYAAYDPWHNRIDAEVVGEMGLCNCGGKMVYQGFERKDTTGGERHAIAYCNRCLAAFEF
jgi:hypothetical protein